MRLEQADKAHQRSSSGRIQLHIIRNPSVETLFGICKDFTGALRNGGADDSTISEGRSQLFRFRRLAIGLPLAFDQLPMRVVEIRDALRQMLKDPNYGSVTVHLRQAIEVAESLLVTPTNSIDATLRSLSCPGAVVVTKDSHMSAVVVSWLKSELNSLQMTASSVKELRNIAEASKLIYLGDPLTMARNFVGEDWRFVRDPRAFESHFIMYPFGQTTLRVPGLLPGSPARREISSTVPLQVPYFDSTADIETEWSVEERQMVDRNVSGDDELVLARYVRLAGDQCTFLDAQPETKVFTVTADSQGKLDVLRESAHVLEAGSYIVLRVEGAESDFIQQEADRLGARNLRSSQRCWQIALKEARQREGSLARMRDRLKTEHKLETTGLADWLNNPRRIGPGSEADFVKLCTYLGISDECRALWVDLQKIRGFHLTAGARAPKVLRSLLEMRDATDPELRDPGFFTIERGDQGAIGIYRILHMGENRRVDAWRIGGVEKVDLQTSIPPNDSQKLV